MLTIIENEQNNSKKFVSTFQFLIKIDSILFEVFSWQKSISLYFSLSLFKRESIEKLFFVFKIFEIVFIFTFLKANLNQSFKLTKIISFQFVYSSTISRISVLKKKFQIRFVISSMNLFDFFNTIVFFFSISSISAQSIFFNHFLLKNFFRNSTIFQNEKKNENVYKNFSTTRSEKFESNKTANAEFSIKSKSRWKFKIFVKIDNENEKIKSNNLNNSSNLKSLSESKQTKQSKKIEFNLNFIRFRIQKLKNSQSLFSFLKHHFSFNTSQFFSNTSMNSNENEQNEIDENDFSFEFNLFQQDIQNIVLFMFNLFKNNIAFKNDNVSNNNSSNDDWKKSFRTQNVEFFDFILNESYDFDDVIQVKKNVYYKNVYFFVKRIKNVVNMYTIEKIRCEGVYRGFVLICKKFDIGECWGLAHFKKHTQLNATKKIKKFVWNVIYLIVATESFFLII